VIQRLATGGILRRPRPENPGGSVADYSAAVLTKRNFGSFVALAAAFILIKSVHTA